MHTSSASRVDVCLLFDATPVVLVHIFTSSATSDQPAAPDAAGHYALSLLSAKPCFDFA